MSELITEMTGSVLNGLVPAKESKDLSEENERKRNEEYVDSFRKAITRLAAKLDKFQKATWKPKDESADNNYLEIRKSGSDGESIFLLVINPDLELPGVSINQIFRVDDIMTPNHARVIHLRLAWINKNNIIPTIAACPFK